MKKALLNLVSTLVLSVIASSALAGNIVVIANPQAGVETLTADDVMRIFLAKTKTLPNQKKVIAVAQKEGLPQRQTFDEKMLRKTPNQVKAYWTQLIFTGRGTPPEEFPSDVEIKKRVAENPLLIGYIDSDALDESVRVVFKVE